MLSEILLGNDQSAAVKFVVAHNQIPRIIIPELANDSNLEDVFRLTDRGHYLEVDATVGSYKEERQLEELQDSVGKPVLVIRKELGNIGEFLLSQGLEVTGQGFADLIHHVAMRNYSRSYNSGYRLTYKSAYDDERQEMRFIGTSETYWDAKLNAITDEGQKVQTTLRQFVTRRNLFSPLASRDLAAIAAVNTHRKTIAPIPGLSR